MIKFITTPQNAIGEFTFEEPVDQFEQREPNIIRVIGTDWADEMSVKKIDNGFELNIKGPWHWVGFIQAVCEYGQKEGICMLVDRDGNPR